MQGVEETLLFKHVQLLNNNLNYLKIHYSCTDDYLSSGRLVYLACSSTPAMEHLVIVVDIIVVAPSSTDHGNKSLFDLIISKELSERLVGLQNTPATKCVTIVTDNTYIKFDYTVHSRKDLYF